MSLRKANITWRAEQITSMIKGKKISFDNLIQRSFVWDKVRKGELIESMIIGYPIPPVYAKRGDDRVYDILDGKQRLTTIQSFLDDEFPLIDLPPIKLLDEVTDEIEEYDISKMKFSELPEKIKKLVENATFTIFYYDDITKEEEREMFRRINAGKPLSVKEKNIANCKNLESIIEMGGHFLFEDMFSKKAYDAKAYVPLIVKIHAMLNNEIQDVSFESKVFNNYMAEVEIDKDEQDYMSDIFDLMEYIHATILTSGDAKKIAAKVYKETHLVSLVPFIKKCLDEKYNEDIFTDWIMKFFDSESGASVSEEYNAACASGSAKPENVQKRHKALQDSFNEFYSKIEQPKNEE